MVFQRAMLVLSLYLIPVRAAAEPARVPHEARQGPISTELLSQGPGPASPTSSSTSTSRTTTMSQTSSISPSSASPTSSVTPQPSSASSIIFAIQNMTTCTSSLISWNYTGTDAGLALSITNFDINYTSPLKARQSTVDATIQQQLAVTNTAAKTWTWPSVNVTQGWYEIEGVVSATSTVMNTSAPFFVSNGTDITCLTGTSLQVSATPFPSSTSSASSNVANIIGGVLGAFVGAILLVVGLYLWRQNKRLPAVESGENKNRKWGSLQSTNSSFHPEGSGPQFARSHFHAHPQSTGATLQDGAGGKVSTILSSGGSVVDVTITGEDKFITPTTSPSISPFEARYGGSMCSVPTTSTSEGTRSSASRRISNQSLEQQAQRIRSSMETPIRRRSERLSVPTTPSPGLARVPPSPSYVQRNEEYPLSPVAPAAVDRSVSTGSVSRNTRRTSRKPVPQYDASLLLEDTKTDSTSTGAESSQSHGAVMASGTPPFFAQSFGNGRPVHYLIPDLPSPQRD